MLDDFSQRQRHNTYSVGVNSQRPKHQGLGDRPYSFDQFNREGSTEGDASHRAMDGLLNRGRRNAFLPFASVFGIVLVTMICLIGFAFLVLLLFF